MRRADAAQVCSPVAFVAVHGGFVALNGVGECSFAMAARHIVVSERW